MAKEKKETENEIAFFFPPGSHHSKLPSHRLAPVGLSGGGLTWRLSKTIPIIYFKQNLQAAIF